MRAIHDQFASPMCDRLETTAIGLGWCDCFKCKAIRGSQSDTFLARRQWIGQARGKEGKKHPQVPFVRVYQN